MDTTQLTNILKPILIGLFVLCWGGWMLSDLLRVWRRDRQEVITERATVYWKNPEPKQFALGRGSMLIYHVTFHTDGGNALTLYMNRDNYFALQEGDTGLLTWQADRFWKFIKEE